MRHSYVLAALAGAAALSLVPASQAGASPVRAATPTALPSIPWGIDYVHNGVDTTGQIVANDIARTKADDGGLVPPLVDVLNDMLEGSGGTNGLSDPTFPAPQARAIVNAGATPMLTTQWTDNLASITSNNGNNDRAVLTKWAKAAYNFDNHHTILIRPWRELNGNWYPWGVPNVGATEYVKAWRDAYDIIHPIAPNVLWVWNVATGGSDTNYAAAYPGDAYVDYTSFDSYVGNKGKAWTATQPTYNALAHLGSGTKPIMVPEFSIYTSVPGLTDAARAAWITSTFADAACEQPRVVSMDWFNGQGPPDGSAAFDAPGWPRSEAAFDKAIDHPVYSCPREP